MPGVEDKIFAQDGLGDFFAGVAQVFESAAEEFGFGEDGECCGAVGGKCAGEGHVIEWIADDATRGRGGFEFGDDVQRVTRKGCGEIAERRGGGDSVFERGFGQHFFAVFDGGSAGVEDAVEDGAGVGGSLSGHLVILYGWVGGVKLGDW